MAGATGTGAAAHLVSVNTTDTRPSPGARVRKASQLNHRALVEGTATVLSVLGGRVVTGYLVAVDNPHNALGHPVEDNERRWPASKTVLVPAAETTRG